MAFLILSRCVSLTIKYILFFDNHLHSILTFYFIFYFYWTSAYFNEAVWSKL